MHMLSRRDQDTKQLLRTTNPLNYGGEHNLEEAIRRIRLSERDGPHVRQNTNDKGGLGSLKKRHVSETPATSAEPALPLVCEDCRFPGIGFRLGVVNEHKKRQRLWARHCSGA